ncbi:hypothetical protein [Microbacterium sp. MM2322]|uniref:hypothetical protein n=1 Tax=Microbacterium sp. MM2322 TaxID=3157631 RepID=UPI0032D56C18
MSRPFPRIPAAVARQEATCMCRTGRACSTFAPGHALHLVPARLADADPAEWIDAVVTEVSAETGEIELMSWSGAERFSLWNGAGAASDASPGDPVAYHRRHGVLAVGSRRFNALSLV